MFRGDSALNGIAAGNLPAQLAVNWNFKTSAAVRSSPSIVDGEVFIGSNDGQIYCLNLKDGKQLWTFKTEGAVESSPLVVGSNAFAGSSDNNLYALDVLTGNLLWEIFHGR